MRPVLHTNKQTTMSAVHAAIQRRVIRQECARIVSSLMLDVREPLHRSISMHRSGMSLAEAYCLLFQSDDDGDLTWHKRFRNHIRVVVAAVLDLLLLGHIKLFAKATHRLLVIAYIACR